MPEETLFRLRVRYVETGRLRYLSHLELLRAVERTVRRSGVPYAVTQGFSPRIKAAYGPALPVGVASRDEWFDLWLRAYRPAGEYLAALRSAAPDDLAPQEAAFVDLRAASLSAALTLSTWEIELAPRDEGDPGAWAALGPDALSAAFDAVLGEEGLTYLRDGKPKRVPLAGKIARAPRVTPLEGGRCGARCVVTTRSSNEGALRPDVLMRAVEGRLAETFAEEGGRRGTGGGRDVSCKRCLRTSIVRLAQYTEGEDGQWVRPI